MLKRCFSLIVAFAMVFSLLPVQAFAEGTPETEGEQPVQETQVLEPVSDPEPETEPAPAETDPVPVETDPVPAETDPVPVETDPVPVETEPVPVETEPVPAETVPEETVAFPEEMTPTVPAMDAQVTDPATVDAGEVTFEFRVMGDTTIVAPITVAMGEFIELPDCTAEYPDLVFGGWALHRSDDAVLSVDGIFVTNDQGIVELEPGATIEVTADLFDPDTYGYYFEACWYYTGVQIQFCFKPLALNHNVSGMLAQDEQIIQIPACTEQNAGHTFAGWYLADPGGAWLTADGEFTLDESKSARLFTPGEYFTVDTDFFNENMIYTFQGVWEDAVIFTNSDRSEATTIKYGDDLVFPGDADTTWVIQRSDSKILVADGTDASFQDVADLHEAWLNPGGGTLTVLDDFLDGTKYTYTLCTFNEGMGGPGGEGSSTNVTTEDELRTALADAQADSHVWVEADITLTSDVNVPEDVYLHIDENATLTVSEGVVLSVDGCLYVNDGLLNLASGAVLTVGENGWISVDVSGKLQATGADLSGVDYIWVSISGEGQITGVPASKLDGGIHVYTFAQLKEALTLAENFRDLSLRCCDEVTVTENLTLPRNVALDISTDWIWDEEAEEEVVTYGNFIIASGVTVTVNNHIGVESGCTLTVSEGAYLNSSGSIEVYNEAKVVNNGTIAARYRHFYDGHIYEGTGEIVDYKEPGLTEAQLREALQEEIGEDESRSVRLTEDITLTADLTIPKYFGVQVGEGATLTVPAGITLTMEGDLYIDGTVKVEPGASIVLIDNGWNWLGIWDGTLDVAGADISQLDLNKVELDLADGAQVIGIPTTELHARCSVENVGELKETAALAGMYRSVNISIYDTITVTEDLEIPENVYITIWSDYNDIEAVLAIASGVNLTTYGNLQVGDDATLNVESGSQLTVVGFLSANSTAKIINNGTIAYRNYHFNDGYTYEGTGEMTRIKAPGMNEEALRAALTGENTWIQFTGNITLTGDLVIPRGYSLSLEEEASIDVPAGVSLIVEGDLNIYDGAVTVAPGGSLVTVDNDYSWVNVGWYGRLDLTGSDTSGIIPGRIHTQLGSNGVITGIPTTMCNVTVEVETTEDILAGMAVADQYNYVNLSTWRTFSITEDLVLPRNVNLNLNYSYHYDEFGNESIRYADVTIAPGVTVTARNGISVQKGTTLTISEGSELYLPGWLDVWGGTVVNNGTIYETANSVQLQSGGTIKGSGKRLPYEAPPMTEDALRAEVEKRNGYAELTNNMTLTADLTIAEESTILLQKGAVLTVPAGVTLTVEGMLDIVDGKVKVEEGGAFRIIDDGEYFQVYVGEKGYLDVTGADISGIAAGDIYFIYPHSSNIQGIPADKLTVAAAVNTYADLTGVLAVADQYHSVFAEIQKSMTISKDLYIPYNAIVDVYALYNNSTGKTTPSKVTISSGATITNDGVIAVYNDCTLTVNSGCEIYNGTGYLQVVPSATLVNNGTITSSSENIYFDDGATIKGSGKFNIIEELVDTSVEEILAAYENGSTVLRILGSTIEFTESIELPKDLKLEFIQSTVTISEGVTVTAAAELAVSLYDNSTLYLDGTFSGKEIFLSNDSAVEPAAKIVSARDAAAGGRYVKLGLPKATALNIFEIVDGAYGGIVNGETLSIDMKDQPTFQLGSSTEPFYASNDVTWKSSSTSIATVDAAGLVTFKKPGTVTITATTKDGSKISASVKFAVTYLDKATKLTAAAEVPTIGLQESFTTTMLVYGNDKEIPLDPADLTFSIPAKEAEIASVDENGVITAGTKAGTATVTAAITGDPLGRKISVKVKVIALQTDTLFLLPEVEEGSPTEIIQLNPDTDELPKFEIHLDKADVASEALTFVLRPVAVNTREETMELTSKSLKWVSSDTKVATVAVNADGSATVTVKAKTDGVTTISATTTDLAKLSWEISLHVQDKSPRIETTSVTLNTNMETGAKVPVVESYGNSIMDVTIHEYDSAAKAYAEEPSERLAVVPAEYGQMEIVANDVIKNSTIKTQLRVQCVDGHVYTYNISVKVANTLPTITVKQPVKFNLHTGLDTELTITAKNAVIADVVLDSETTASFYQAADFDPETGILYLAASDAYLAGEVAMDAKVDVVISLEGYREPITKAVTIGTSSTKPTVTVKQPAKFNLFYSNFVAQLQVTFKGMEGIEKVELDPTSTASFEQLGEFDFEHGTLAIKLTEAYLNKEVKLDTSAKLLVYPVGRETPITKTFTISTVTTKPSVKLSAASSIINTALDDKTTSFTVVDNAGTLPLTEEYVTVTAAFADASVEAGAVKLTLKETNGKFSGGTATIMVQMPGWTQAIKLTHKVTVQTALPTPTLGASTLKLNRIFTETTAETTVKLNQSNQKIGDIEFTAVTKGAEDIVLTYEDGIIKAAFAEDMETAPKNGNYKFDYVITLDNEAGTKLAKKSITVNVASTVPTAKLKATTLKLNKNLGIYASAETTVSLTKGDGYILTGMALPEDWNNDDIEVVFDAETGALSAYLLNEQAAAKKHTVSLYPVLLNEATGQEVTLTTPVKLTVQVLAAKVSISVSAKGKLDTMNPDSSINYTVSKLTNIVGDVVDVTPAGDDAELFDVELDTTGTKPVAVLTRKDSAEVATNKTYKLQLVFAVAVNTRDGIENCYVVSNVSFKVSQTALKFATVPTQKLYLFQNELTCTVTLNTPATAALGDITLSSKTVAAFKNAMGDGAVTFELADDGRSAEVHFAIEHPGYLVNGKSYTVYLDITPANNATNVKPTQVKLTVKAYK